MKNSNKLIILVCLLLVSGLVYSNLKLKAIYVKNLKVESDFTSKYSKFNHIKIKGNGLSLKLTENSKDKNAIFSNINTIVKVMTFELKKDTLLIDCIQCNQANGSVYEFNFEIQIPSIESIEGDSVNIKLENLKLNDLKIKGNKSNFNFNYGEIQTLTSVLNHLTKIDFSMTKVENATFAAKDSSSIRITDLKVKNLKIDASENSKVEAILKK